MYWPKSIRRVTFGTLVALGISGPSVAEPGLTDTEIVIGDVEPLTGPPALQQLYGEKVAGSFARNAEEKRRLRAGSSTGWTTT